MGFIADKQTIDDLNITGRYKSNSIFSLFNRTSSRGGEQLLERMFMLPLSDAADINKRNDLFRYFQDKNLSFPVGRELCDEVEQYLGAGAAGSFAGTALGLLRKRLSQAVGADKEYDLVLSGIVSVIELIYRLKDFFSQFCPEDSAGPYGTVIEEMKRLFSTPALEKLLAARGIPRLSLSKVITFDHFLRHRYRDALARAMQVLYETDVYIAVARVARERGFSYARAIPFEEGTNRIELVNVFHPGLPGAVANSLDMNYERNVVFLTGANMAGKSTFMKSYGIAVYLAHMGFPVAAERMLFSVQDGMYTSINVPDNLGMGYSHFYAEVLRVKQVAEDVSRSKNMVVIFDELFKGTNVKDAYDATVAVTEAFADNRNCTFIVSTHIAEAGDALRVSCPQMNFVYFPTVMNKNIPHYTYKLQEGISADRHGMTIIVNEGIIDMLLSKI